MAKELYLVTGAAGFTGKFTIDELLRAGKRVRALVRTNDARSDELQRKGAEVQVGDLFDFDSVRTALEDVTAAYFTLSVDADLLPATAIFAQATREANLKAVVNMSQISARRKAKSHTAFKHWLAERVFDWSSVPVVHLRPTFFAQWLLYPFMAEGNKKGLVEWGWSTGKHAPIAAEDQARLIATILQEPTPHLGKTYPLFGPKEYTATELYAEVSRVLGREVQYRALSESAFAETLSNLKPVFAQHIEEVVRDHTNGVFSGTDHIIEAVTGTPPMGIAQFVAQNRRAFDAA